MRVLARVSAASSLSSARLRIPLPTRRGQLRIGWPRSSRARPGTQGAHGRARSAARPDHPSTSSPGGRPHHPPARRSRVPGQCSSEVPQPGSPSMAPAAWRITGLDGCQHLGVAGVGHAHAVSTASWASKTWRGSMPMDAASNPSTTTIRNSPTASGSCPPGA